MQARYFSWKPLEVRGLIAEILVEARLFGGLQRRPPRVGGSCWKRRSYLAKSLRVVTRYRSVKTERVKEHAERIRTNGLNSEGSVRVQMNA